MRNLPLFKEISSRFFQNHWYYKDFHQITTYLICSAKQLTGRSLVLSDSRQRSCKQSKFVFKIFKQFKLGMWEVWQQRFSYYSHDSFLADQR